MSIDPIKSAAGVKPMAPTQSVGNVGPVTGSGAVDATAAAFAVAGAARIASTEQVTQFALFKNRIQEGLARKLSRDAILEDLIAFETTRAFGSAATGEMRQKVADQFRTDPRLNALFGNLIAAVQ